LAGGEEAPPAVAPCSEALKKLRSYELRAAYPYGVTPYPGGGPPPGDNGAQVRECLKASRLGTAYPHGVRVLGGGSSLPYRHTSRVLSRFFQPVGPARTRLLRLSRVRVWGLVPIPSRNAESLEIVRQVRQVASV